ncbi:hypothetical protein AMTR_s00012p00080570 [Amborella trichopoda]|uniref:Uncharacterized protein n=1 Tax=Amborella trichopoda TaxID=13333 RepID=W1PCW2_AMBTC|nr:hypothetical protein AMTR_s00012p00080570 [Amborella trichopoda]
MQIPKKLCLSVEDGLFAILVTNDNGKSMVLNLGQASLKNNPEIYKHNELVTDGADDCEQMPLKDISSTSLKEYDDTAAPSSFLHRESTNFIEQTTTLSPEKDGEICVRDLVCFSIDFPCFDLAAL